MRGGIGIGTMKSRVMRDRLQYLKRKIQGNNEFVKEVIEEMLVGRSQIGEKKTEKYRYRTEIEIWQPELKGGIADRVEGGGEKDLFAIYGMYKERMTEVDYWGGVGFNASASCLWNGACVDGRGAGEISKMWGCGAREPAALPEHCTVWFWRREEGHSNLSPKDFGRGRRWGGVFRLGGVGEIQRISVLERMWDKRREKGRKVEEECLSNSQLPLSLLSLYLYLLSLHLTILDSCANA